jgi:peroxiredoxin
MLDIPLRLLSDFNRQVVGEFGIDYTPEEPFSGFWVMSRRSVFVVDGGGTIRYACVTDDPLVAPRCRRGVGDSLLVSRHDQLTTACNYYRL